MKEINIARTLIGKRREKGVTQEELADFIGVSKASVSKWETGQSYPDIIFLPQLAAYFNISLDELMGYEPQMTAEDIDKLYKELALEFGTKPFDEVMERCRGLAKKYFSCFPLLFHVALLYTNYGYTVNSADEGKKAATLEEAKGLIARVKENTTDALLARAALHLEATCELMLGNAAEVIGLLENEKIHAPLTSSVETLTAQAYMMLGKTNEAMGKLQAGIFNGLMSLVTSAIPYLGAITDDARHFEEACSRMLSLIDTWDIKGLVPLAIMPFYLQTAAGYLQACDRSKALSMLEAYTDIAESNPFAPTADDFFRHIEGLDKRLMDLPRDILSIKKSIIEAIADNPAFSALADEPRFKITTDRLKKII